MATKVQFAETTSAKLSSLPVVEGRFTFVTDTKLLYRDTATEHICVSGTSSSVELGTSTKTTFNSDGSITELDVTSNDYTKTTFESDGSIKETVYDSAGTASSTRTTTFNEDGSIISIVN